MRQSEDPFNDKTAEIVHCSIEIFRNNFDWCKEALTYAQTISYNFYNLFQRCRSSAMPNQQFHPDDIQKFINFPSKTTVGTAPKFTMNRKFFANMLSSAGFKQMVEEDEEALKKDLIKKLKYCDEATMDKELLKDFYDREVDQSKI
ncbi:hypothetical protein ABMA28_000989 [Loxostege sticticalis]|uniref:Uncharacterized protein n=1 Tax=Loxostege sticticalis TaxID=481309 RepID=A0ABD0T4G5_LOXSC